MEKGNFEESDVNNYIKLYYHSLDEIYDSTLSASVIERFDARAFKFTTLATYKQFQKQMRLLKPAK